MLATITEMDLCKDREKRWMEMGLHKDREKL